MSRSSGVFVSGTGTEVGKTVLASVIARTIHGDGLRVLVFKPVESGLDDGGEPDHALLRRAAGSDQSDDQIAPHRYGPPVSPHLAAVKAGDAIDVPALVRQARAEAAKGDALVCEGAGGLLVPLAPGYLVRDLAREIGLPMVVAASPGLGTINHTLLTLEAARAVGLHVAAVVLTPWPDKPGELELSNRAALERIGAVPVLTLPHVNLGEPSSWPPLRVPATSQSPAIGPELGARRAA